MLAFRYYTYFLHSIYLYIILVYPLIIVDFFKKTAHNIILIKPDNIICNRKTQFNGFFFFFNWSVQSKYKNEELLFYSFNRILV